MLRRRQDLPLGHGHVFFAPRHDEDGLLAPHRRLDVGVCLGSERLDLTACVQGGGRKEKLGIFLSQSEK